MARGRSEDLSTLEMALVGYQIEKDKIDAKIRQIHAQLKGKRVTASGAAVEGRAPRAKRVLSPSARKRIAAAQKKRWAEHRRRLAEEKSE
jgi:hypothetical protein